MFTAALLIKVKSWKQPKCPSTGKWLNKLVCIHTMECYLAIKKKKLLIYTTTWMDLQVIMLSKKS